ncbi:MAG: hypoxanthine phosphoribosyltransferase [Streptococcaceae bacterium]|nr:hypoxanthine phosphoribosyltransferase [Streptococcaceae bacterium]MCL2681170.1 hypoxanthine phosphoribosyltransferase [Streptococcaceae bacterium]MCL2858129.1 hypoxanthine phosphoribosyltransferase [Streptococcaceae bacterium]
MLEKVIERVLISEEEIQDKTVEMGRTLAEEYADQNPLILGILRGSVPFLSDLIKRMDIELEIDFMNVSSYAGTESTGEVKMLLDLSQPINGRQVLIVEDIIDTGRTLKYLKELLEHRGATVKIATLLDKPDGRVVDIEADYVGFTIPNEFVVGYGLDYDEHYRNFPFVGVLKKEIYSK